MSVAMEGISYRRQASTLAENDTNGSCPTIRRNYLSRPFPPLGLRYYVLPVTVRVKTARDVIRSPRDSATPSYSDSGAVCDERACRRLQLKRRYSQRTTLAVSPR